MLRLSLCLVAFVSAAAFASAEEVSLGDLKSKTPPSWKSSPPSNKFRAYQASVPKAKDDAEDAELVVFFFGPGGGGGVADNLKRWKSMFEPPASMSIEDFSKVETFKVGKAEVTYLDVTGTYVSKVPPFDPNGKITRKSKYRRLGVYFDVDGGPYFITLTGPAATVSAAKADFDSWLKNFK